MRLKDKVAIVTGAGAGIRDHADLILQTYQVHPQIFLRELRDALREHGVHVTTSSLSRLFARQGNARG